MTKRFIFAALLACVVIFMALMTTVAIADQVATSNTNNDAAAASPAAAVVPQFEAGASRLTIEGIHRGISVESIRAGRHLIVLSLGGGSARFSRALTEQQRLDLLRDFFRSARANDPQLLQSSGPEDLGAGSWDAAKSVIFAGKTSPLRSSATHKGLPAARATVSTSGRSLRIELGAAPDFDLDVPERVTLAEYLPGALLARGSRVAPTSMTSGLNGGGQRDFVVFPDGRVDVEIVDTGVPMASHPLLLDLGLAQNANTSFPLKVMRGRDCRANAHLMDVEWPESLVKSQKQQQQHGMAATFASGGEADGDDAVIVSSSTTTTAAPPSPDDPTIVEFTPTVGSEQITLCYVPMGEYVSEGEEGDGDDKKFPPIYVAAGGASSRGLSIAGPMHSGTRTVAVGESVTVQVLGFNLTLDDVAALAPSGECSKLHPGTALQLPMYLASSSMAEATVQVPEVGVFDLCYWRDGAAAFVPVASVAVTHTDGRHKTHDVNVSKGISVDLTGNIYSQSFRVLDGGTVRLNSHQVNTTHFEWRDGVIEGWGGINCQLGEEPHVIAAASNREIAVSIQNYGVMVVHVDHLHFTGQGAIHNHRHLTLVVESRKAVLATADHLARRIINGVRGRIDIVIGSSADVAEFAHPILHSTALFENLGTIVVSPHLQVQLRRVTNFPIGTFQLQTGAVVKIESGVLEGAFVIEPDAILAFAGGDLHINGADFDTADKSQLIFNAQHFIRLSAVTVRGFANVILHSNGNPRRRIGPVLLDGTTTFGKGTILAIKNVSISAQRDLAYLNVLGRLVCHIPSVELGDNIVMHAALNSVFFGSSDDQAGGKAKVVPQRVPPNNSAFVLPANASLYLVDVGPRQQQQQQEGEQGAQEGGGRPHVASKTELISSTTQICAQYLIVPIRVELRGDVHLHGCAMLPLGGSHTGSIYGSSASASSVIENTNKFAFCKTALAGGAEKKQSEELLRMKQQQQQRAAAAAKTTTTTAGGDGDKTGEQQQQQQHADIVSVPRDVCISLGSGDEFASKVPMLPAASVDGIAFGGTHVFEDRENSGDGGGAAIENIDGDGDGEGGDDHNGKGHGHHRRAQIHVDRVELLPRSVLEATTVLHLLAHRGILVRPEAILTAPLGGKIGSTILSIEGTFVVDASYPLQIDGTMHVENNAKLVVRVQQAGSLAGLIDGKGNDAHGGCSFPLWVRGGCSFLDQSHILIDASEEALGQDNSISFYDLSAPILHAEAGVIGVPLINWSSHSASPHTGERAIIVRHGGNIAVAAQPEIELPTPYRKKLAVVFVVFVAAGAAVFFIGRIGTSFVTELLSEPVYPMHLGIAEFWASSANWFAVLAAVGEAVFLCAPAMIHTLRLPPHFEHVAAKLRWMVTANHTDGWEGPWRYVALLVMDFIFVFLWLTLYRARANPESQRSASPLWQRWYQYAQQLCIYMTFFALAGFVPITAALMEPISCKFLYRGAFDCHHSEPYLYLSTFALLTFLVLAPLSGTSLRTPFSHPPFMRDLDIRYKRTYVHLQCVLLGAAVSLWKIFGRDAVKLQLANLVVVLLMFLLYRASHPCIYDNVNTFRRALFLIPTGASLAALVQLWRFDGRPSLMCSGGVEWGYLGVFMLFLVGCIALIVYNLLWRGKDGEQLPSFDPALTAARELVHVRNNEMYRIQVRMYNAHTAADRARLADELADKRVEYQQALRVLRKKLEPMQMRFYLGDGADQLVLSEQHQAGGGAGGGAGDVSSGASSSGRNLVGGGGGDDDAGSNSNDNDPLVGGNNNNNDGDDDQELDPILSADPPQCIPASAVATPEELRELTPEQMSNYTEGPILGRGTYGTVYMAMLTIGKLVAVKVVPIVKKQKAESLNSIKREVDVLRNLSHPNVIRCYGCSYPPRKDCICIFMELATSGSLTQIVRRFGGLNEAVVQVYTRQILRGLQYLHTRGVIHRDVKGENILIDGTGVAKLGDFGCSKFLADVANKSQAGCASLVGSPFWMAPEVIRNEAYGTKADVWSLGCTVVEMLNGGHPPWCETFDNVYSAMFFIGNTTSLPSNMPENVSEVCRDFLGKCFDRDVSQRASVAQLLEHPWLSNDAAASPTGALSADMLHTAITTGGKLQPDLIDSPTTAGGMQFPQVHNGAVVPSPDNNAAGGPVAPQQQQYMNGGMQQVDNGGGGAAAAAVGMPSRGWSGLFDGVNTSGDVSTVGESTLGGPSTFSGGGSAQSTL